MDRQGLEYNALDAAVTLECGRAFWRELEDYQETYDFTIRLLEPLKYMMARGIATNRAAIVEESARILKEIEEKQERLNTIAGRELNANSPLQLREYFYIQKGIPAYTKRGPKGESVVTVDDNALARIARGTAKRAGLVEAALIQDIRGLIKMRSTYLEIQLDPDGRFRCSCNPRGTRFGRISTSKTLRGTGMNMQNLPPRFKRFLVPDPGYLMVELDKRQAEWVVVAYLSSDANMIKVIEENLDPHLHTAHLMSGLDYEIIKEENSAVGHETDDGEIAEIRRGLGISLREAHFLPRNMSLRQCGKKSNHGLNYDETFKMFALINGMLESEAKTIIALYHRAYPGIKNWHASVQSQLRNGRMLSNCFGRRYHFLDQWGPELFKAAYAFQPQSTVADLTLRGMTEAYEDQGPELAEFELLSQVHDSVLVQIPYNIGFMAVAEGVKRLEQHLDPELSYNGRTFHIKTDMKMSVLSWGDMEDVDLSLPTVELAKAMHAMANKQLQTRKHSGEATQ